MRVTPVYDDVAFFQVWLQLGDEAVDCRASLDEKDYLAGTLELGNELLNGVRALDFGTFTGKR